MERSKGLTFTADIPCERCGGKEFYVKNPKTCRECNRLRGYNHYLARRKKVKPTNYLQLFLENTYENFSRTISNTCS